MYKNVANQKIVVYAHNNLTNEPETGDAANITAHMSQDSGSVTQSNDVNPTELDATNMKGLYTFDLTQAESNGDEVILSAVSATNDVDIEPVVIHTQMSTEQLADVIHDEVVEGTITYRQVQRLMLAILTGKSSGGGSATLTFRDIGDAKDRITATVDKDGNRTAVVRDGT